MEHRVTALETRLDTILPTLATKSDVKADIAELRAEMHEGFSGMIKWIVGSALALGVAGITVITFVLNNATPRAAPQAQPQPIIINIPAQANSLDAGKK